MRILNGILSYLVITVFVCMIVALVLDSIKGCACAQSYDKTALALAQCLVAECDRCDRGEEKAAVAWVLWKGMERYNENPYNTKKRSYYDQIKAYCAVFDRRSKFYYGRRARLIRRATYNRPPHIDYSSWRAIVEFSEWFLVGAVSDPIPDSRHFGGIFDTKRARRNGMKILKKYCNRRGHWCTYIFGGKR